MNDCVALRFGEPLSVTTNVKVLVVPLSAGPVCQVIWPLAGENKAAGGAPDSRLQVSVCAGTSLSVAPGINENSDPSAMICVGMNVRLGGVLPAADTVVCASPEAWAASRLPAASVARL